MKTGAGEMQRLEEHIEQLEVEAAAHRRKRSSSDEETPSGQDGESDGVHLMLHAVVLGGTYLPTPPPALSHVQRRLPWKQWQSMRKS